MTKIKIIQGRGGDQKSRQLKSNFQDVKEIIEQLALFDIEVTDTKDLLHWINKGTDEVKRHCMKDLPGGSEAFDLKAFDLLKKPDINPLQGLISKVKPLALHMLILENGKLQINSEEVEKENDRSSIWASNKEQREAYEAHQELVKAIEKMRSVYGGIYSEMPLQRLVLIDKESVRMNQSFYELNRSLK